MLYSLVIKQSLLNGISANKNNPSSLILAVNPLYTYLYYILDGSLVSQMQLQAGRKRKDAKDQNL